MKCSCYMRSTSDRRMNLAQHICLLTVRFMIKARHWPKHLEHVKTNIYRYKASSEFAFEGVAKTYCAGIFITALDHV